MTRQYKPKAGFWIRLCVVVLYPLDAVLFRIRWRNMERMPSPSDGGVIVAINHVSQVDTILMARFIWQTGRVPRFMIKSGVFRWPLIKYVMHGAGQIPVYRGTTDAAESLRDAVDALERGEAVVIYPEGTTTKDPDNWPMLAKTGIARLVLLSPDAPVVPVGQWGAHRTRTRSPLRMLRRPLAQASVGKPLDLSEYRGAAMNSKNLREITDRIMAAVRDEVAELRGETAPDEFFKPNRVYIDKS